MRVWIQENTILVKPQTHLAAIVKVEKEETVTTTGNVTDTTTGDLPATNNPEMLKACAASRDRIQTVISNDTPGDVEASQVGTRAVG
ncbi:unnamed protein product [Dibothriocephalus latus]|uniref:Uncharacterized protein n=1 Tax=Dibothriocephalus latus TaxID=60516 RepID=A0A3P7LT33_DIBLA|nr:unnamed protein product [Dibothriocephalus latus]